jgi:hypothetical protein
MGLRLSLATEWGIPFRRPPDTASVAQPQVDEKEVPVASGFNDALSNPQPPSAVRCN